MVQSAQPVRCRPVWIAAGLQALEGTCFDATLDLWIVRLIPITTKNFAFSGGSGKAEGFADGGWANHRQAGACRCHPKLDDMMRRTHA